MIRLFPNSTRRLMLEITLFAILLSLIVPTLRKGFDPFWNDMAGHYLERAVACESKAVECASIDPHRSAELRAVAKEFRRRSGYCRHGYGFNRHVESHIYMRLTVRELALLAELEAATQDSAKDDSQTNAP